MEYCMRVLSVENVMSAVLLGDIYNSCAITIDLNSYFSNSRLLLDSVSGFDSYISCLGVSIQITQ
jgi:hypothetical protein